MDIITHEEASSSSSSSAVAAAADIELGGRTLDRHNPIICDARRNLSSTGTLLTPPRDFSNPPNTPKKISSKPNRKSRTRDQTQTLKKSSFVPSDIVTRSFGKLSDLVTPAPAAGSSRYLLGGDAQYSQVFEGPPELGGVPDVVPAEDHQIQQDVKSNGNENECSASTTQDSVSRLPDPPPTKQVVVLTVSLHCKGCEGKVRKHLSRMKGVTSFNIDYAAKRVTIEGDVTPVGVLASVSKLKHAKFWSPVPPTSPPPSASTSATTETPEA